MGRTHAGNTCVLSDDEQHRRRPPTPSLTDWCLLPERLACAADPEGRRFFSLWNAAQCDWVAAGFDPALREVHPRGDVLHRAAKL